MKVVKNVAAQGEMLIRRVNEFDDRPTQDMAPEGEVYIIAHSETGHHHVIDREKVSVKEVTNAPEGLGILQMIVKEPTEVKHLREYDTHESLMLGKGLWEVRLQREYTPEGYRRVAD